MGGKSLHYDSRTLKLHAAAQSYLIQILTSGASALASSRGSEPDHSLSRGDGASLLRFSILALPLRQQLAPLFAPLRERGFSLTVALAPMPARDAWRL
jgi:hypothetical protein